MSRIVLKVDVDTWHGTREGVPRLLRLFDRRGIRATFLFSLGPDRTGRALRRVLRTGFLAKVSRSSVLTHYGLRTLLYGSLLPAPDIGRREAAVLRSAHAAGHECGVHCWDHSAWQDLVAVRDAAWTHGQLRRAVERYTEIFGAAPRVHGAAGWQMNEHAYRLLGDFGFDAASDGRGDAAYQPVDDARQPIGPPQWPTSLPTLDEMLGLHGCTPDNVHDRLLARTAAVPRELEVFTLHAELEGRRLLAVTERLLEGWAGQGRRFVTLGEAVRALEPATLPRRRPAMGRVDGRSGLVAV